jgi:signal transduction histidine kinase
MSESSERAPGIDGELARRVAHEVRSPLGVIVGGLDEVAARQDLPADAAGFLQLARRSAGRLERLVERMDWIAAIQAGSVDQIEQPEPLSAIAERGVREAEAFAGRRGVEVTVRQSLDASAPRVPRPRATRQIVQELAHNAIRHARSTVDIEVSRAPGVSRIRIEHNGPALDPERLLVDKPAPHPSGLGIGLWICRELSDHVGATLSADATGVTLELPDKR